MLSENIFIKGKKKSCKAVFWANYSFATKPQRENTCFTSTWEVTFSHIGKVSVHCRGQEEIKKI